MFAVRFPSFCLSLLHIIIICISNILVLFPITIAGYHSTYGALTYPLIFILTDLTTRILGPHIARKTIFYAFFPGLILSYCLSSLVQYQTIQWQFNLPLRVAVAGVIAYIIGQLMDICVFQPLRNLRQWWVAPTFSTIIGNIIDTYVFFFFAFYKDSSFFYSAHWLDIANTDLVFKFLICQTTFIPLYGFILSHYVKKV